jgi:flagellar hook protein FlgE
MMRGMYAAISGLEAHQTMLDVTANNLANVDTIGYKAARTTFVNELSQLMSAGSGQTATNGGTNPQQVGLGVQVGSIDNLMSAGSLQATGNPLDVAIQGNGFLCVGTGTPGATPTAGVPTTTSLQFTRAGNLTTDSKGYLCTASGQYVIGSTTAGGAAPNTYLLIPPGSTNVAVGQDGSVTYTDQNPASATYQQSVTAGFISLASFPNEAGLTRLAGSNWTTSANSGAATFGTPNTGGFSSSQTISGELEQSNVDMATEFTNMIEAERGYQANSRAITTADRMLQTLVQMAA